MGIETAGSISMHSPGCSQKRSEKTLRKCLVWDRHERRNQQTPGGYKTLLDPFSRLLLRDTHFSLLGSSVHGILQARILEWHFLLQEIFLTQGSNSGLLHCTQILYHLRHQGSPNLQRKGQQTLLPPEHWLKKNSLQLGEGNKTPLLRKGQEHLLDQLQLEDRQEDREGHSSKTKGWGQA